jgi:uncharacterized protein
MTNERVLGDYKKFIHSIVNEAKKLELPINYPSDHVCYRVSSLENYKIKRSELLKISKEWLENEHHGRLISKFILKKPLIAEGFEIPVVELPAPSSSKSYKDGLEHIELVVGGDYKTIIDKFDEVLTGLDDSGTFNQPRYVTFDNGITIKYHELSIIDVVKLEGKSFQKI